MALTTKEIKKYRRIGHSLQPVVTLAEQGLSEGVQLELERALNDHELIKIRVNCNDREAKRALISEICATCRCEIVQKIGKVALLYRPGKEPNPRLSNLLRFKLR